MSPFIYANKINEPILLIHGERTTTPARSRSSPSGSSRRSRATAAPRATSTLPYEAHGYAGPRDGPAPVAEIVRWLDKYVKNATAQVTTEQRH